MKTVQASPVRPINVFLLYQQKNVSLYGDKDGGKDRTPSTLRPGKTRVTPLEQVKSDTADDRADFRTIISDYSRALQIFKFLRIILDYYGYIDFFLIRNRDFYGLFFGPWVPKNP